MIFQTVTLVSHIPYTIGDHHVPPRTSTSVGGSTVGRYGSVKTSHDTMYILDLPLPYSTAIATAPTYIILSYQPEDYTLPKTIYGWITGIEEIAGRDQVTRIKWEIDYWRTYARDAILRTGHIIRCPYSKITGQVPAANIDYGTWSRVTAQTDIRDMIVPGSIASGISQDAWRETSWALVMYTQTTADDNTRIVYAIWPASDPCRRIIDANGTIYYGIPLNDIYNGYLSEKMGIQAENIIGAWLLPFCPISSGFRILSGGSSGDPVAGWQVTSNYVADLHNTTSGYAWFVLRSSYNISYPGGVTISIPSTYTGDDTHHTVQITDGSGQIVWRRPWTGTRTSLTGGQVGWAVDGTSAYMYVRMQIGTSTIQRDLAEGMVAVIPLSRLPVVSNTWQSYNLSGQRDLEIIQAKANAEAGLSKSVAGSATGAIEGALTGAIVGAAGGPIGAGAGLVIGLAGSLISTTIGAAADASARRKIQNATDYAVANTAQSLLLSNDSPMSWYLGGPQLLYIAYEGPRSKTEYLDEYGWVFEKSGQIAWSDITSGPWQIEDLAVVGPIPPAAREAIKQMFSAGIYIDSP